ncbi:hypothetical protein AZE42_02468, partial [Rhizopogon vesiculosus]
NQCVTRTSCHHPWNASEALGHRWYTISSANAMVIRAQISPLTVYFLNMTMVSDDPSWWPVINFYRIYSYVAVASSTAVMYDWALTFGQEVG